MSIVDVLCPVQFMVLRTSAFKFGLTWCWEGGAEGTYESVEVQTGERCERFLAPRRVVGFLEVDEESRHEDGGDAVQ